MTNLPAAACEREDVLKDAPKWIHQKTVRVGRCDKCGVANTMKAKKCDQLYPPENGKGAWELCPGKLVYTHTAKIIHSAARTGRTPR